MGIKKQTTSLPVVQIHDPCPKRWAELDPEAPGDPRRFCNACTKHVYDLSSLHDDEIESLMNRGEKICARILRHQDGSIVSKDRPIKKRPPRRREWFTGLKYAAAILTLLSLTGCDRLFPKSEPEPAPVDLTVSEIMGQSMAEYEAIEELGDVMFEEHMGGASAPPPKAREDQAK